jgi:hypothetical protein
LVLDQDATSSTNKVKFFPESGTMTIAANTPPADVATNGFDASLENVKLIEVTLAGAPDYTSTPVPNGACLYIASASLKL